MRERIIRKIGGSLFIPLYKSDALDFGLVEGDPVDIDDLNLMQMERTKSKIKHRKDKTLKLSKTKLE